MAQRRAPFWAWFDFKSLPLIHQPVQVYDTPADDSIIVHQNERASGRVVEEVIQRHLRLGAKNHFCDGVLFYPFRWRPGQVYRIQDPLDFINLYLILGGIDLKVVPAAYLNGFVAEPKQLGAKKCRLKSRGLQGG